MSLVVFLQNAWSPLYAGGEWPRRSWLRALARSRSGRRLQLLLGDRYDLEQCENTTPLVGASASSIVPPQPAHIVEVLERRAPAVVVACGKQAEAAIAPLWPGALLVVPHPAARVLTDALYLRGAELLAGELDGRRLALRQRRGNVELEDLTKAT